ncbi:MAG: T9SS type A sorting domain-containing protein [Ignavibacteria bacterium]|nr:T9SS type A sorting domain-containing protein [Ignavibacteria bacterium]
MLKKMSTVFFVILFATFVFGQAKLQKAPGLRMDDPAQTSISMQQMNNTYVHKAGLANWVLVDTMPNLLGSASFGIHPIAYDPYSKTIAVIHRNRGQVGGSGALYYNYSTDNGATWKRVTPAVNNAQQSSLTARYPSMTISNGERSATPGDAIGAFAYPVLASSFDYCGFAFDQIGGGSPSGSVMDHDGAYSSSAPVWASDKLHSTTILWQMDYGTAPTAHPDWQGRLFRTSDFGSTVDSLVPTAFDGVKVTSMIVGNGSSNNGVMYMGGLVRPDTSVAPKPNMGWYAGVMKSTDEGATWTEWEIIDFRTITALKNYHELFDYVLGDTYVSYAANVVVDAAGYPHLATCLADTVNNKVALVELYKDATGWKGNVISDKINPWCYTIWKNNTQSPSIGQMGPSPFLAIDKFGTYIACSYVSAITTATTDSVIDGYVAVRKVNGGTWSTANITQTPNRNEDCFHLAPYLELPTATSPLSQCYAYLFYSYEKGLDGVANVAGGGNPANFWVAALSLDKVGVTDKVTAAQSFDLNQNYPNPFNPVTKISFNLSKAGSASLRVYDVLGREVATLVNGQLTSGTHEYMFNGAKLASGMYIYKLEANGVTAQKKMMLLK